MASRRDQIQSYQFLTQRVISALVMRETDPAQSPLRRGVGAIFAGVMIALVVGAGFGVYGLLTKTGGGGWRVDGAIVVEKETGAVYLHQAGVLHPMLNYTSALLAVGRAAPTFYQPRGALTGVPRGVTLGIPGAPTSLPDAHSTLGPPWTLCTVPGVDEAGSPTTRTTLAVSRPVTAGRALGEEGLLVRDARTHTTYLIWQRHRFEVRHPETVVASLFGAPAAATSVGTAWLNALPAGVDIGPIAVPKAGSPSALFPGRRVGDLLMAQTGSGPQYYLVFDDGLAPITELQRDIMVGESGTRTATIGVAEANSARTSDQLPAGQGDAQPPRQPPRLAQPASTGDPLCAESRDARSEPTITVGGTVADLESGTPTGSTSRTGTSLADSVVVPAGQVALVRAMASATATTGAYNLVTDLGVRYPVSSEAAVQLLGYRPAQAVDMPASLVNRIPAGPTLDPVAARQPVEVGSTGR